MNISQGLVSTCESFHCQAFLSKNTLMPKFYASCLHFSNCLYYSCYIMYHTLFLPAYLPIRRFFCIYFSSSRTEFWINVSNFKYTIVEIADDMKIVIFSFSYKCFMCQSFITIIFYCHKKFYRHEAFYCMRYLILIL